MLEGFTDNMVGLMFGAVGATVENLLAHIGLSGLETLVHELSTGDGALDEAELADTIVALIGTLTPDQAKKLVPIAKELITIKMGNSIGDARMVFSKSKRPAPGAGSQVECAFYVTAKVSGRIIETYSDFTVYGKCKMDCIRAGALKCPCGCHAEFEVWVEGKNGGFAKPSVISSKKFK
jgi:hypothetical protein